MVNLQLNESQQEKKSLDISEIPPYLFKAYALFFIKYGLKREFGQKELEWIVGESMKKKIFALLLKAGWIAKKQKDTYVCLNPEEILKGVMRFKIPDIIKGAKKNYCFTGLSAIEIWSDYSYVQRSWERSPYFIKVLKRDLSYWKSFFNKNKISHYVEFGRAIGEFIILIPVKELNFEKINGFKVEKLGKAMNMARNNEIYAYAYNYMREKYG